MEQDTSHQDTPKAVCSSSFPRGDQRQQGSRLAFRGPHWGKQSTPMCNDRQRCKLKHEYLMGIGTGGHGSGGFRETRDGGHSRGSLGQANLEDAASTLRALPRRLPGRAGQEARHPCLSPSALGPSKFIPLSLRLRQPGVAAATGTRRPGLLPEHSVGAGQPHAVPAA